MRVPLRRCLLPLLLLFLPSAALPAPAEMEALIYHKHTREKPTDSTLTIQIGAPAPEFSLPAVSGKQISLADFRDKHNVVLSFVPAAWTPICSDQWPGYNLAHPLFAEHDAVLLGITVDNLPTLHAWTSQMGNLWFEVLSDFWPHGGVAASYGLLRSSGVAERALIFIDRHGIIQGIHVSDINIRPPLELLARELEKLNAGS